MMVIGLAIVALTTAARVEPTVRRPPRQETAPPTSLRLFERFRAHDAAPLGPPAPRRDARVTLEPVVQLEAPTAMASRSRDSRLFVAEQAGRVMAVDDVGKAAVFIDLTARIKAGGERGLLGLAFSNTGHEVYVNYTDLDGNTNVDAIEIEPSGRANPSSRRRILFQEQPYPNHNGGALAVLPDGTLTIAVGDGGSAGDPQEHAQDLSSWLGKILRVDPRGRPYAIPVDNPFSPARVDAGSRIRPEIWFWGLRNPWRISFDRLTGDLWIGDVGQNKYEEIDRISQASLRDGANLGWNRWEGRHAYRGTRDLDLLVEPVIERAHDDGWCSITGGYVYRGRAIPWLRGTYVYGDFCRRSIMAARLHGDAVDDERDLGIEVEALASFGEDADGELYTLSLGGQVSRLIPG